MLKAQMVKSKAMKELNQVDLKDSIYLMLSWTNPDGMTPPLQPLFAASVTTAFPLL